MSPSVSAQIIAKAWSDESFAQALRGLNPYAAVQDALGPSGPMDPANVPHASEMLREHAELFGELEGKCSASEKDLQEILDELSV